MKLRTYVALVFAIIMFILTTILSFSIGRLSSQMVKEEIGNSLATTAYQMANKLDYFMWSRNGEIEVLSQLTEITHPFDIQAVRKLLDQLKTSIPAYSWIGLTDVNGKVLAGTDRILEGGDLSKRPVYQEGIKGHFIGDVHEAVLLAKLLPHPNGEPLQFVDISKTIVDENGNLIGVLATHLSWEWSREVEKDIIKPLKSHMKQAEVFVVRKQDNTVILGPESMIGQRINLESVQHAQRGQNNWSLETWPDGKTYLTGYALGGGYRDYSGLQWTTLVRIPIETAFQPVTTLQKAILWIGIGLSLVFAIVGWFVAGFIAKPLEQISNSANLLRSGQHVEIPYFKGIKDIELLSLSIRELVNSLVRAVSDLGKMESIAHHDALTGLPNRIALGEFIEEAMQRTKQQGKTLTFLYLDLDGFKQVNDTHGHQTGDLLLQEVSNRLKECIRENDAVFRIGGDEFVVVLSTLADSPTAEAAVVAEKIIASLNLPFYLANVELRVGCSVGGAVWPQDDITPITVVRYADEALYVSKRTGKNKVTFHAPNTHIQE